MFEGTVWYALRLAYKLAWHGEDNRLQNGKVNGVSKNL